MDRLAQGGAWQNGRLQLWLWEMGEPGELGVACIMFASVGVVLYGAITRLFVAQVEIPASGIILAIAINIPSIFANFWLWRKNYKLAQEEPSPIMESQWRLYRSKVVTNTLATVSYMLTLFLQDHAWTFIFDPIFSVILAAFLAYSAYIILTNSVYDLLDRTLEESLQMEIVKQLATYYDEYKQLHGVSSRRSGGKIYIELLLEFDGSRSMGAVQEVINEIRQSLEDKIPNSCVVVAPVAENIK